MDTFSVEVLVHGEWLTLGERLLQGEAIALHAEAERHRDAARILDSDGDVVREARPLSVCSVLNCDNSIEAHGEVCEERHG